MEIQNICHVDGVQLVVIEVSLLGDTSAICTEILHFAQPDLAVCVELRGEIEFYPCRAQIIDNCARSFADFTLVDHTQLLCSQYVEGLAQEKTVRGCVARQLVKLYLATKDQHQRQIYELTLRELLHRFAAVAGEGA